jgi:hypothetical protein
MNVCRLIARAVLANPATIDSAHARPVHLFGRAVLKQAFPDVARPKSVAEMPANVLRHYSGLGMEFTLDDRVAAYYPAPPAGGSQ